MSRLAYCLSLLAVTSLWAGCRSSTRGVGSTSSALTSCNDVSDCTGTLPSGVSWACTNNFCTPTSKGTCLTPADCNLNDGCSVAACNPVSGACSWSQPVTPGAGCCNDTTSNCAAASVCQNAPTCDSSSGANTGTCNYVPKAKSGMRGECCTGASDCQSPATCKSSNNICTCGSGLYCDKVTTGSHCVTGSECCQDSDCGGTATCNDGTCTCASGVKCGTAPSITCSACCGSDASSCSGTLGSCQAFACSSNTCVKVSSGGAGCCNNNTDCDNSTTGATCNGSNQCVCPGGDPQLCTAPLACIPSSGCCTDSQCTGVIPNGTGSCNLSTHTCQVASCNNGFHDCSGACVSVGATSCGSSCTDCTAGLSACQSGSCSGGTTCVTTAKNLVGCCSVGNTGSCSTANSCQTATCDASTDICGVTSSGNPGCCNPATVATDCGVGASGTCTNNQCGCTSGTYCASNNGGPACVSGAGACCTAADCPTVANGTRTCVSHVCGFTCNGGFCKNGSSCVSNSSNVNFCGASCMACPSGNGCQTASCSAGTCGFVSNGNTGCCNPATVATDCGVGGSGTCTNNTCGCTGGQSYCSTGNGGPACVSTIPPACCTVSDCPTVSNGSRSCTSHACGFTCNSGFCSNGTSCVSNSSNVDFCGASCVQCAAATNSCQTPACTSGSCGYVASGGSPCCNTIGNCVPPNSCQQVSACTNNQCQFTGRTSVLGCCNPSTVSSDCPRPSNPCLQRTCVANQCATSPINGCILDMATPLDMTPPPDLSQPLDLSVPLDMSAPRDLAVPDLAPPPRDLARAPQVSVTGGGGCSVGGDGAGDGLAIFGIFTLAFALRRRRV